MSTAITTKASSRSKRSPFPAVAIENPNVKNNAKVRRGVKSLLSMTAQERVGVLKNFCYFCGEEISTGKCECPFFER
jgi:hypothetical protein